MTRYIFVTGGVVSSLGKGITISSLAAILRLYGYKVILRKLDPYLNIDPGTMSPTQHGEVFVTEDGVETDLDLGHYERFTGVSGRRGDSVTAGKIYATLLEKERRGDYLGGTVQVIPHVTDLIKQFITANTKDADFVLCEIGGTVGDIEGLPFFEAIRQLGYDLGPARSLFVHLTLLPYVRAARELKTKPTQHSVKELRSIGIQPGILLCRADREIPAKEKRKIALFCNVPEDAVISALDVKTIYQVPLTYHAQGLEQQVFKAFGITPAVTPDFSQWEEVVHRITHPLKEITIAIVGKYTKLKDAYKSLTEALDHAGINHQVRVKLRWINARLMNSPELLEAKLTGVDAILVPGGFGKSGIEGKIEAVRYARTHNIPFFGICFGMQLAIIEACRHLLQLPHASSSEFGPCEDPVVGLLTEWQKGEITETRQAGDNLGGTMRLGSYDCVLAPDSKVARIYQQPLIKERHRHRYEVNLAYRERLEKAGIRFVGMSPDGKLPEIIEISSHPWFIAVQFHPEFQSSPFKPHPLFNSFVEAAIQHHNAAQPMLEKV